MGKEDIKDFLKEESDSTDKIIDDFISKNGFASLTKEKQIIEIAKKISEIPWGEARTVEELLSTKKYGTCTARHTALELCYKKLGINCRQITSIFHWGEQGIQYPGKLQSLLDKGEWDHTHNFLRVVREDGTEIDVDITWNPELEKHGFKVLPRDWDGNSSFYGLKTRESWDGVDMKKKKIELIESLSEELRERREEFLKLFVRWIHSINEIE